MGFLKRLFGEDDRPQPPTAKVWTEAEYGALLERVLAGVAQGWDRSRVLAELGDRVDDVRFYQSWLAEKFGLGLLKATTRDEELVRRLGRLGELGCGQVSVVAGQLSGALLEPRSSEPQDPEPQTLKEEPALEPESALAETPRNETAEFWFQQGDDQWKAGKHEEAINSCERAIQLKPDFHRAWSRRGTALDNLGRNEEAVASYDHALHHKPDDPDAWSNRGIALYNLGGR